MNRRTVTTQDQKDWDEEMQAWGMTEDVKDPNDELIPLWEDNWSVIEWWFSIPNFLNFNGFSCTGMNVLAVKADAEMSERQIDKTEYGLLKLIARTLTEELNSRE